MDATVIDRFWSNVDQSAGENACWPWKLRKDRAGYGAWTVRGRFWFAHRFAYFAANGELRADLDVLHSCDVRPCCNPSHLRQGTHDENMRSMRLRGRGKSGGWTQGKKLDAARVLAMRAERETNGTPIMVLSRRYEISPRHVRAILQRESWKYI